MSRVPEHVAMIMDGNGRWAEMRGKSRLEGHRAGVRTVERVVGWCRDAHVRYLTLYAFSTENWKRPAEEVGDLMKLMTLVLKTKAAAFRDANIRVRVIGRRADLSQVLQRMIAKIERMTDGCDGLQLILAISYGGRSEIAEAAYAYACAVRDGKVSGAEVPSDAVFRSYLYASDVPDPDMIIRTSGEFRLSNFLLWQSAYSEFWATPVMWPDFGKDDFSAALASYATRNRRMGGRP